MTAPIELTGLDAKNPLAFLAALGLLRVLDDHARSHGQERPRLSFVDCGQQMPILNSVPGSFDDVVGIILKDAARRVTDPVLQLAYDGTGKRIHASEPGATRDLKPQPFLARSVLDVAAVADRSTADLAAAFFSELVQDNNGNTKPTAFHFTAGQQTFLKMVDELRRGIGEADLHEALIGPWTGLSTLPSLSWDSTAARHYALSAGNPSKEKRGSVPAANWLGVLGLSFFPVSVVRRRLETTRVKGLWKTSVFSWPLWSPPTSSRTTASLLRMDILRLSARDREALGVSQVFGARILRSDQGGYGSFSPASVEPPRSSTAR